MNAKKLHLLEYNTISYFLFRNSFIGICISNLFLISRQDSWLAIILATILGFIPLGLYYLILTKNPKKNINDFIKDSCPPIIGKIVSLVTCLAVFLFTSLLFWSLINFISSQYLYKTPDIAIAITFALVLYYISNKSINVIGRTANILFYLAIILFMVSITGLVFQINLSNIKPILETGFSPIFKSSLYVLAYNVTPLFLLTIIPLDQVNNQKHFVRNSVIFYIVGAITIFIVLFSTLTIYGANFVQVLQYPSFHILKRISSFGFIQRVESILSLQWIMDIFISLTMGIYFVKRTLEQTIKVKECKISSFILITLLLIVTNYLFKNNTVENNMVLSIFPFIVTIFFFFIPAFIYVVQKIKEKLID